MSNSDQLSRARIRDHKGAVVKIVAGILISFLTPFGWVFQSRRLIFEGFVYSGLYPPKPEGDTERWLALRRWGGIHPWTTPVSALIFVVSIPALAAYVSAQLIGFSTSDDKIAVAQLVSVALFGTVAIETFLLFQLPALLKPRVSVCVLEGSEARYVDRFHTAAKIRGDTGWIHLRVTNVGVRRYRPLSVACVLPENWVGGSTRMMDRHSWE